MTKQQRIDRARNAGRAGTKKNKRDAARASWTPEILRKRAAKLMLKAAVLDKKEADLTQ